MARIRVEYYGEVRQNPIFKLEHFNPLTGGYSDICNFADVPSFCGGIFLHKFVTKPTDSIILQTYRWFVSLYKPNYLFYSFLALGDQKQQIEIFKELDWYTSNVFVNPNTGHRIVLMSNLNLFPDVKP